MTYGTLNLDQVGNRREWLPQARTAAGLTVAQLAAKVRVTPALVRGWEARTRAPKLRKHIDRLTDALGVNVRMHIAAELTGRAKLVMVPGYAPAWVSDYGTAPSQAELDGAPMVAAMAAAMARVA